MSLVLNVVDLVSILVVRKKPSLKEVLLARFLRLAKILIKGPELLMIKFTRGRQIFKFKDQMTKLSKSSHSTNTRNHTVDNRVFGMKRDNSFRIFRCN